MRKTLEVLAWITISMAAIAWFWPAITAWIGLPIKYGMVHLAISATFMLLNLTINGALFWLYGGLTALRRFREIRRKNNEI